MAPRATTAPSERSRLSIWARQVGAVALSFALAGVCLVVTAGAASADETTKNGRYYNAAEAEKITRNLVAGSTAASVGCGMHNMAKSLKNNKAVGKTYLGAIAQSSGQAASKFADSKGFCKSAAQLLAAATLIAFYAHQNGGVFVMETTTTSIGTVSKTVKSTFDIGPGPGSAGARSFTTSTKMGRWQ